MFQHQTRVESPFQHVAVETFLATVRQVARELSKLQALSDRELAGFEALEVTWERKDEVLASRERIDALNAQVASFGTALKQLDAASTAANDSYTAGELRKLWETLAAVPLGTAGIRILEPPTEFSLASLFKRSRRTAVANRRPPDEVKGYCKQCEFDLSDTIGIIVDEETRRPVKSPDEAKAAIEAGHTLAPLCTCPECSKPFSVTPVLSEARRESLEADLRYVQRVLSSRGHWCSILPG